MTTVSENRIRLALIGAGNHSRGNHAPAMAQYAREHPDQVELAAVCDLQRQKAESFAKTFGFRAVYTDYLKMMEKERLDGCVCVMPIELTASLAIDLMERNMPVTVEKPMGDSLEEIQEIVKTAEKTGTPNMVSVNRRFDPLIRRGLQWAEAQGPLRYVRASILRHNRREPTFVSGTAIHPIDALRSIGGEIAHYQAWVNEGEPHWLHIVFTYSSEAIASLDVLPTDGSVEERYEMFGDGFRVDVCAGTNPHPRLRCWKDDDLVVDEHPPEEQPPFVRVGAYAEIEEFVAALAEERAPWPSVAEVYPSVEIAFKLDPGKPES
jgi:predicted dehydrogenase